MGALVLVATPIGNLADLSPRAREALASADVIACEDTRRTRRLLSHADVRSPHLLSVHDHNEAAMVRQVLQRVEQGQTVAVVTDAGTPGIADPGQRLVAAAAAAGLPVTVVPGPSAVVAALVVSGLSTSRFCFEGFLPRKGQARSERLALVAAETRTTVLYEAPHRARQTVADLAQACGGRRRVALVRELTKLYEEVWRGTLEGALAHLDESPVRGELAIVVDGAPPRQGVADADIEAAVRGRLGAGLSTREAVAEVAAELDVGRRRVYEIALRL